MPKIIPLHDRLVVKQQDPETKTAGGIVIPDTADKDKPMQGDSHRCWHQANISMAKFNLCK